MPTITTEQIEQLERTVTDPQEPPIMPQEKRTLSTEAMEQLEEQESIRTNMAVLTEAELQQGAMAVPDELGNLQLVPKTDNIKYGPTIRAANITYLANAFDMDDKAAEGVYDSLVTNIFGDKEPVHLNMSFVKQWQQDKFLQMNGIDPKLWRLAINFIETAGKGQDWQTKINTIPEDRIDEFFSYVYKNAVPKEYGFWAKAGKRVQRGTTKTIRAFKNQLNYYPNRTLWNYEHGTSGLPASEVFTEEELKNMPDIGKTETTYNPDEEIEKERRRAVYLSKAYQLLHSKENLKGGNKLSRGFFGALEMAPATVGSLAANIIPGGGVAFWYIQSSTELFENMVSNGIDPEKAGKISAIAAIPYAYTEMLERQTFLPNILKQGGKQIVKKTFGKFMRDKGIDYLTNMGQETIQAGIDITSMKLGDYLDKESPDIDYKRLIDNEIEGLKEAALALPWMMGPGGAVDLATSVDFGLKTQTTPNIKLKQTVPNATPITDAERLSMLGEVQTILEAMGEHSDNPFGDELRQRLDILKKGGSKEELDNLRKQYDQVFGNEGPPVPGEISPKDKARMEIRDLQAKQGEDVTAMDKEVEEIQRQAMETGRIPDEAIGKERPFAFDKNSTAEQGRFTLKPIPEISGYFDKESLESRSQTENMTLPDGITAIVGLHEGSEEVQSLQFDRTKWTDEAAGQWWEDNRINFKFFVPSGYKPKTIERKITEAQPRQIRTIEDLSQSYEGLPYSELMGEIRNLNNKLKKPQSPEMKAELQNRIDAAKQIAEKQHPAYKELLKTNREIAEHDIYRDIEQQTSKAGIRLDPTNPIIIDPKDWGEVQSAIDGNPYLERCFVKGPKPDERPVGFKGYFQIDSWATENFIRQNETQEDIESYGEARIPGRENTADIDLFIEAINIGEQQRKGEKGVVNETTLQQAIDTGEPTLQWLAVKRDMLRKGFTLDEVQEAEIEFYKELKNEYESTEVSESGSEVSKEQETEAGTEQVKEDNDFSDFFDFQEQATRDNIEPSKQQPSGKDVLYHGTDAESVNLQSTKKGDGYHVGAGPVEFLGISLSKSKDVAQSYGKNVIKFNFEPKNPKQFKNLNALRNDILKTFAKPENIENLPDYYKDVADSYKAKLQAEGYDSVIFLEGKKNAPDTKQSETIIPISDDFYNQAKAELKRFLVSEEQFKAAGERLAKDEQNEPGKGFRQGSVLGPEQIRDLMIRGAYYFESGIRDIKAWTEKMIAEFGEVIREHLPRIWAQIRVEQDMIDNALYPDQKYADSWYNEQEVSDKLLIEKAKTATDDGGKWVKDKFIVISSRLYDIAPFLLRRVRRHFFNTMTKNVQREQRVLPLLTQFKTIENKVDMKDLSLALFNGDRAKVLRIFDQYNIPAEFYEEAQKVLDEQYIEEKSVGMDTRYRKDYWPIRIKDWDGFQNFMMAKYHDSDTWSAITQAIKKRQEQAGGRPLTNEEKAKIASNIIRGFRIGGMTLAQPGFTKGRTIPRIESEMLPYLENPAEALISRIRSGTEEIEKRRFFGKGSAELTKLQAEQSGLRTRLYKLSTRQGYKNFKFETYETHISEAAKRMKEVTAKIEELTDKTIEQSVGDYVTQLVENKAITPRQERELQTLLSGIFDPKGMSNTGRVFANLNVITLLGSPLNALTQLKDMGIAASRDPAGFAPAFAQAISGKSEVTLADIGITDVGVEFTDQQLGKKTEWILKHNAFNKFDKLGKQEYINTVLNKYRKEVQDTISRDTQQRLNKVFGDEAGQVIEDLRSGQITDNIRFLLFNELCEIQPLTLAETPLAYAKGGDARLFYSMRLFTLRQFNFIRDEVRTELKENGKMAAMGKLVKLAFFLSLFGVGVDTLKDFILGKPLDLEDNIVNNISQYIFMSRYNFNKFKQEGVLRTLAEQILPPTKVFDVTTQDLLNWEFKKTPRAIPIGGELYYWWFGAGSERNARSPQRTQRTRRTRATRK